MSGIHLVFNPSGIDPEVREIYRKSLDSRTTAGQGSVLEKVERKGFLGASRHHGVLPSGGIAADDSSCLLSTGSVWIRPECESLSSPQDILNDWEGTRSRRDKPFGGVFAVAHYDWSLGELTVLSDRFGALPIYYRVFDGHIAVSTEIKFLTGFGNSTFNQDALGEYLGIGHLGRPHTFLKEVQRLPSHFGLFCHRGGCEVFSLPISGFPKNRTVDASAFEEYDSLIQRSLGRYNGTAPRFSLALSGGLDSRLLAVSAQRAGLDISAFSVGEANSLDASVAGRVAGLLDIPMNQYVIDGSQMPGWFAKMVWFTEARVPPNHMHYMSLNLSGSLPPGPQLQGLIAETHLGGYLDNLALLDAKPDQIWKACLEFTRSMVFWPAGMTEILFRPQLREQIAAAKFNTSEELYTRINCTGTYADYVDFKYRVRGQAFTVPCLMSQVLPWTDVVSPFLDTDVFDFAHTLDPKSLGDRAGQIAWGLQTMPVIAELPRVKDGVILPVPGNDPDLYQKKITWHYRKILAKQAICRLSRGRINLKHRGSFPFYGQWYRNFSSVRNYVDGILLSDQCLDRGLFRREGIKPLLHSLRVGKNTWDAVGSLLLAEIFARQFIDGTGLPDDPTVPMGIDT